MILETPRLILRPFAADDLDRMAELMANKDFMRFSMGPMTAVSVPSTSRHPAGAGRPESAIAW